jgi:hypothetical protein
VSLFYPLERTSPQMNPVFTYEADEVEEIEADHILDPALK